MAKTIIAFVLLAMQSQAFAAAESKNADICVPVASENHTVALRKSTQFVATTTLARKHAQLGYPIQIGLMTDEHPVPHNYQKSCFNLYLSICYPRSVSDCSASGARYF